jgi:hypothetical protein
MEAIWHVYQDVVAPNFEGVCPLTFGQSKVHLLPYGIAGGTLQFLFSFFHVDTFLP